LPAGRGPLLDPVQRGERSADVGRGHAGQGLPQVEHHPPRDPSLDRRSDRAPGDGRDASVRAERAARLVADGGDGQGSRGSSRSDGHQSETEAVGDFVPDASAESAGQAPDQAAAREPLPGGSPDAAEVTGQESPPVGIDLVWAGRSGAGPGVETVVADSSAGPPVWGGPDAAAARGAESAAEGETPDGREGPAGAGGPELGPRLAGLLAGVVPFDGAALERGAEQFFTHLQELGHDPTAASLARRVAPWLAAGALAAAAGELARRQRERPAPKAPGLAID
jgi:hypothetical protein